MYSWDGPGSGWVRQADLPDTAGYHTMIYDEANKAIWTYAGHIGTHLFRYSMESRRWQRKQLLQLNGYFSISALCNEKFIIIPGGVSAPSTILLMDISTEHTIISNTRLPIPVNRHVVACITSNP